MRKNSAAHPNDPLSGPNPVMSVIGSYCDTWNIVTDSFYKVNGLLVFSVEVTHKSNKPISSNQAIIGSDFFLPKVPLPNTMSPTVASLCTNCPRRFPVYCNHMFQDCFKS